MLTKWNRILTKFFELGFSFRNAWSVPLVSTSCAERNFCRRLMLIMPFTNDETTRGRKNRGSVSRLKRARAEKAFSGVRNSPAMAV